MGAEKMDLSAKLSEALHHRWLFQKQLKVTSGTFNGARNSILTFDQDLNCSHFTNGCARTFLRGI